MTPDEIRQRASMLHAQEIAANDLGLWWLSFADESGFKGVVIVEAFGFTDALSRSHALGVNPGGEVQGSRITPDGIPEAMHNRLLKKADLAGFGVSTKGDV